MTGDISAHLHHADDGRPPAAVWRALRVGVGTRPGIRADLARPVVVGLVTVVGEVDRETVPVLHDALAGELAAARARGARRIVVDTAAMTFCGVAGLGALARTAHEAAESGVIVAVAGLGPRLQALSTALWPAPHPVFYPDRRAAVTAVALGHPWSV